MRLNVRIAAVVSAASLVAALLAPSAAAQRAWVVADANSGEVVDAHNAKAPSYPASLTKLMTVYIALQDLQSGELELGQKLEVSKDAARQPPVDMALAAGSSISVKGALLGVIVRSANDAAVVVAEGIAGSEAEFVRRMNYTAADLGMHSTHFRNASGLPNAEQLTTAHDMILLVRALQDALPKHYALFKRRSFEYAGRTIRGHNGFLGSYQGSDGLKTGFTCRSGFSLAASAQRRGRRIIGVVLGAKSAGERSARMRRLFDRAFKATPSKAPALTLKTLTWAQDQGSGLAPNGKTLAGRCSGRGRHPPYMAASGWSLEFAVAREWDDAVSAAQRTMREQRKLLRRARPLIIPRIARDLVYRVGLTGLKRKAATEACLALRKKRSFCVVLTPRAAEEAIKQGKRALAAKRKKRA